ncbi:MAG: hypothetical protein J6I31_05180 [Prevotella sp.]|nr:hypothetical protein [Prevotella sp.]
MSCHRCRQHADTPPRPTAYTALTVNVMKLQHQTQLLAASSESAPAPAATISVLNGGFLE